MNEPPKEYLFETQKNHSLYSGIGAFFLFETRVFQTDHAASCSNIGTALELYITPASQARASNGQNRSSPKYNKDISLCWSNRKSLELTCEGVRKKTFSALISRWIIPWSCWNIPRYVYIAQSSAWSARRHENFRWTTILVVLQNTTSHYLHLQYLAAYIIIKTPAPPSYM